MMQQLLTTSRQLTLGAYKHETECMWTHNKQIILKSSIHMILVTVIVLMYIPVGVFSQRAGAED